MTSRITEAWAESDRIAESWARANPDGTITAIRDLYGRCSFAIEKATEDQVVALEQSVRNNITLSPYLATRDVYILDPSSALAGSVRKLRQPVPALANAFVIERLLVNESWTRAPDHNPAEWPPIVAFYSFKGGVGRTTTTALTALTLAREGKRVVVVDLDLEAPGIEGYFFSPEASEGKPRAGIVDYLLEREIFGSEYKPDMDDFVVPYSDSSIAASGGSLTILPAGNIHGRYLECLGRVNLADIGRKQDNENPLRLLIDDVLNWRAADIVLVDCRTGFTDLGGVTMNGLSTLDALVFRGGEADRRYLPLVLEHIQRFRSTPGSPTQQEAEKLARSFLVVYTMMELPSKAEEAEQYLADLRHYTAQVCWEQVFKRFEPAGYSNPDLRAQDSPLEPVAHDFVVIPYLKEFFMISSVTDMLRFQTERPERPYDSLVRRLIDVKLQLRQETETTASPQVNKQQASLQDRTLEAIKRLTETPAGEAEFSSQEDFQQRFLPRAAYRTLLDPKAFLILGRKGAGKSALFQILTHQDAAKQALFHHLNLDVRLAEKSRWEIGFAQQLGFPEREDFLRLFNRSGSDLDVVSEFWRNLAAHALSRSLARPLPSLTSIDACIDSLGNHDVNKEVRSWLEAVDHDFEKEERFCFLSYDDLDIGMTQDSERRALLLSALVTYWQQAMRRFRRLRAKIFVREDIYSRDIAVTDKSKIRDGVERGTITWDGLDIYRSIMKRLGHDSAAREFLKQESLWLPGFDEMLSTPLGFIPPQDPDWVQRCIHVLAGKTMASGPSGHKRGYVYSWVLDHVSDSAGSLRPRYALLLFSEAARLQGKSEIKGALLNPNKFREALRGEVSRHAVEDLKAEFKEDWSVGRVWLPAEFASFRTVWPVDQDDLIKFWKSKSNIASFRALMYISHMNDAGLLEIRTPKGRQPQLQIPDIYLFGLGLTRKG